MGENEFNHAPGFKSNVFGRKILKNSCCSEFSELTLHFHRANNFAVL